MSIDMNAHMTEEPKQNASLASKLKGLWPFGLILVGFAVAYVNGWHEFLTLESIRANIGALDTQIAANFLLVFFAFMFIYAACTAFMVPASFLTIAGGAIFGLTFGVPLFGALATVFGATLGASILFLVAKTSLGETLRSIAGPFISKMEKEYNEAPILYLIILRLVPAVPFAVANIAPSLLGAKFRNYLPTTFFGIMPGTVAYSWIGASAAEVIRDPNVSLDNADAFIKSLGANVFPAFIALFVVSLIPIIYKRFFKKDTAAQAE